MSHDTLNDTLRRIREMLDEAVGDGPASAAACCSTPSGAGCCDCACGPGCCSTAVRTGCGCR